MDGGVSAAILRVGGPSIVEQARGQLPIRPGRALVTSAGDIPVRFIFHGVTVGFVGGQLVRPSRDLIAEIMASCFYHADSHEVRSIAFPLLGTGAQGFPRDVCLDTMFQFLARTFLRGLTAVREARIVIYPLPR
jgi:O-acetyl-ADP-ribose deacetylase (regulator of RNase III)